MIMALKALCLELFTVNKTKALIQIDEPGPFTTIITNYLLLKQYRIPVWIPKT